MKYKYGHGGGTDDVTAAARPLGRGPVVGACRAARPIRPSLHLAVMVGDSTGALTRVLSAAHPECREKPGSIRKLPKAFLCAMSQFVVCNAKAPARGDLMSRCPAFPAREQKAVPPRFRWRWDIPVEDVVRDACVGTTPMAGSHGWRASKEIQSSYGTGRPECKS